ncbi:thioredoxin-dependent thiol peroxidase [Paenibacillus sp. NFR01]|uniref:thioredoxin-dependent thiol peroxidase n=1 Tax=Paenibacillus sp. NFR01 TaxID=1566279 RepID=UPI0008D400FC|nr:thioredoxin-dependent thiol peroxidase [Paenibacillus sp. NFR01]SEU29014.1 peroxiredoxin Q/BCP [Paenibacillus sp. NFR01]
MNKPQIGEPVPEFALPSSEGRTIAISEYRGRKVVLYFYPKNMTPACTQEACDFRDAHERILARGAAILGISLDPPASHAKFIAKNRLPFPLLSDEDHNVCEMFGVWQLKKLYGREYMGLVRSTFLIDEEGKLQAEWRNVRVKGHVAAILEEIAKY